MRVQLKGTLAGRNHGDLAIISSLGERIVLEDASDDLEALLALLDEGGRNEASLIEALTKGRPGVSRSDVVDALDALDKIGLLLDSDAEDCLSEWQRERHARNLAFFSAYASLSCSAADYQRRLLDSHVVLLGVGGLGSVCLMCLTGLGVGRLTLVDHDVVELRNLARQFVYEQADIGRPKVERAAAWAGSLDESIEVRALNRRIRGPDDLTPLLVDADLMILAANEPADSIERWVNEQCVSVGVPYVVGGGGNGREVMYWSVDPGVSPCSACADHGSHASVVLPTAAERTSGAENSGVSRGIGPGAGTLGSLVSLEVMRYLTGFAPPAAAGIYRRIDICTAVEQSVAWERWAECRVCARAPQPTPRAPARTAARVATGV